MNCFNSFSRLRSRSECKQHGILIWRSTVSGICWLRPFSVADDALIVNSWFMILGRRYCRYHAEVHYHYLEHGRSGGVSWLILHYRSFSCWFQASPVWRSNPRSLRGKSCLTISPFSFPLSSPLLLLLDVLSGAPVDGCVSLILFHHRGAELTRNPVSSHLGFLHNLASSNGQAGFFVMIDSNQRTGSWEIEVTFIIVGSCLSQKDWYAIFRMRFQLVHLVEDDHQTLLVKNRVQ